MLKNPGQFYTAIRIEATDTIKQLKKRVAFIALARLICFALILVGLYYIITRGPGQSLPIVLVLLSVLFGWLVKFSSRLAYRKRFHEKKLAVAQNELTMLAGGTSFFADTASINNPSIFCADLDVFGPQSLYHAINRTTTTHGRENLAITLNAPLTGVQAISETQKAVKKLSLQPGELTDLIAYGLMNDEKEGSLGDIQHWIKQRNQVGRHKWLLYIRFVLPLFAIAGLLIYLSTDNPLYLGSAVMVNWAITGTFLRYTNAQQLLTGKKQSILSQYSAILHAFARTDIGDSARLRNLHETTDVAGREINRLSRLTGLLDQRLNLVVNIFLNSLVLYEVQCIIALEKWKLDNRDKFESWIKAVGEIETLASFAVFTFNRPSYCFPVPVSEKITIRARAMAHPLIPSGAEVANDFDSGNEKLLLVTGSNMSGKSTFLRTIGVNMLLAQSGCPVCAGQFEFTPLKLLTSIRITDSLRDNTSYFMAELQRLQYIISELESSEPALVLIDEVLRGTNSDDKTYGSESLIKRLVRYNCMAMFATHDLSLSRIEHEMPGIVGNYCFESTITGDELYFDYRLRKGVATNRNASFLMEKMGII